MSNHTPGPWLKVHNSTFVYALNEDKTNRFNLSVQIGHVANNKRECRLTSKEELNANARLIAAAPDMLEALQVAVSIGMVPKSSVSDGGASKHSEYVKVADRVRAAITKATGQESKHD